MKDNHVTNRGVRCVPGGSSPSRTSESNSAQHLRRNTKNLHEQDWYNVSLAPGLDSPRLRAEPMKDLPRGTSANNPPSLQLKRERAVSPTLSFLPMRQAQGFYREPMGVDNTKLPLELGSPAHETHLGDANGRSDYLHLDTPPPTLDSYSSRPSTPGLTSGCFSSDYDPDFTELPSTPPSGRPIRVSEMEDTAYMRSNVDYSKSAEQYLDLETHFASVSEEAGPSRPIVGSSNSSVLRNNAYTLRPALFPVALSPPKRKRREGSPAAATLRSYSTSICGSSSSATLLSAPGVKHVPASSSRDLLPGPSSALPVPTRDSRDPLATPTLRVEENGQVFSSSVPRKRPRVDAAKLSSLMDSAPTVLPSKDSQISNSLAMETPSVQSRRPPARPIAKKPRLAPKSPTAIPAIRTPRFVPIAPAPPPLYAQSPQSGEKSNASADKDRKLSARKLATGPKKTKPKQEKKKPTNVNSKQKAKPVTEEILEDESRVLSDHTTNGSPCEHPVLRRWRLIIVMMQNSRRTPCVQNARRRSIRRRNHPLGR
ncbi:hypothetical protein K474DRAFT_268464 [Panus rudis PR-1116 ss-1]|nr:hypothetical protein K474DRAFT_268464 [Panus rudis PR-1116 ss-1]